MAKLEAKVEWHLFSGHGVHAGLNPGAVVHVVRGISVGFCAYRLYGTSKKYQVIARIPIT